MFSIEGTQVLAYHIPLEAGESDISHRVFNWVWYETSEYIKRLSAILTDSSRQSHATTVPRGKMNSEIWFQQKTIGHTKLSPSLLELVDNTQDPFLSAIRDLFKPRFGTESYFSLVTRSLYSGPILGSEFLQAAYHALEMEQVLKGDISLNGREQKAIWAAKKIAWRSNAMDYMAFSRKQPEGYTHRPSIRNPETGEVVNQ